jgi:hypothetical protein
MFKSTITEKIPFANSTLILFFPGKGNSTSFSLSLLQSNYNFNNIGYLYSEGLKSSVSYSPDGKHLEYNGSIYYNSEKNIFILDLTGGIKSRELNDCVEELIKFIKENNFKNIYIIGASSKDNVLDEDLVSKKINIYYLSNDPECKMNLDLKNIKDAFKVEEEKRKGKKYYEMSLLESCDSLKRFVQKLILDKINFLLIFGFAGGMFDPFCGLGLFNKISLLTGLNNKDEKVEREELDNIGILNNFEKKGIKIDNSWKILFKLE